jgi:hypothetical protein
MMEMSNSSWLVLLAILLSLTALALDLTGNWKATVDTESMPGPDFYIRQIGEIVWIYGQNLSADPTWTSGTVVDNTIELS